MNAKQDIIDFLEVFYGAQRNTYGHYRLTNGDGREFRVKIMNKAWRLEEKTSYGWVNCIKTARPNYYNAPDAVAHLAARLSARRIKRNVS